MSINISFISTEDEKKIWFEKFPNFISYIKGFIIKSNHFKIISEDEDYFRILSNNTYKSKEGESYPIIWITIGNEYKRMEFISSEFTLIFKVNFLKRKIVKEKSFFGIKEKIEEENVFINFYPLHITPKLIEYLHRDLKNEYERKKKFFIENNIEWFINNYKKDEFIFETDFDLFSFLKELKNTIDNYYEIEIKEENIKRKEKLVIDKKNNILTLDKDGNGEVDLVDGESFNKLLTKNQKSILEVDKNYIQKFVKISIYLKTKKNNTQKIFDSIKDTKNDKELNELVNLLKNQIHTYELLVFHSINMITSLVESDLITFYEIHE
jgi:hypothetical protein